MAISSAVSCIEYHFFIPGDTSTCLPSMYRYLGIRSVEVEPTRTLNAARTWRLDFAGGTFPTGKSIAGKLDDLVSGINEIMRVQPSRRGLVRYISFSRDNFDRISSSLRLGT
jgi:hypothetical protein